MNKAITDNIVFQPAPFGEGLDQWSAQDGTAGSPSYDGATNATLVAADADFGTCLEMHKTENTQQLRYMGQTPILPGCYLQITVRVKAVSGALPSVRIAGWAGADNNSHVSGLDEVGDTVTLDTYGTPVTLQAIVGTGGRSGVDMVWGIEPVYGHFGLDLTGASGGTVRIEDITITDITKIYHRKMLDVVDVVDFGAIGDGITDDAPAFAAADRHSDGSTTLLVPQGVFYLGSTTTIHSRIRFEGVVTMPDDVHLSLTQNFNYPSYVDAFGDEQLAFKKAFQALFNFTDHESLDLGGRRIEMDEPFDMHAIVGNKDKFAARRVLRNGEFDAVASPNWDDTVVNETASYDSSNSKELTNVSNIASIPVGALVSGNGVGREVYVREVNTATGTVSLNKGLYGAAASQSYEFRRFKYVLDFSGFDRLARFVIDSVDMRGSGVASCLMLPRDGLIFHVKDSFFTLPKDRGITSIHKGCAGMLIDRNQFLSNEQGKKVEDRTSIGFNTNSNDVKLRDNRAISFAHFGLLGGGGNIVTGNHWFQGDTQKTGVTKAGLILTKINCKSTIIGNYIDNSWVEWNNEQDALSDYTSGFPFGGLSITGNNFTAASAASWFRWLVIKPYGDDHHIDGLVVTGNVFKHLQGSALERVERLDTSFADLDHARNRNLTFSGNAFTNVTNSSRSPATLEFTQSGNSSSWVVDFADVLPFGGHARAVSAIVPQGPISGGSDNFAQPYALPAQGSNKTQVQVRWPQSVKGTIRCTAMVDEQD